MYDITMMINFDDMIDGTDTFVFSGARFEKYFFNKSITFKKFHLHYL